VRWIAGCMVVLLSVDLKRDGGPNSVLLLIDLKRDGGPNSRSIALVVVWGCTSQRRHCHHASSWLVGEQADPRPGVPVVWLPKNLCSARRGVQLARARRADRRHGLDVGVYRSNKWRNNLYLPKGRVVRGGVHDDHWLRARASLRTHGTRLGTRLAASRTHLAASRSLRALSSLAAPRCVR